MDGSRELALPELATRINQAHAAAESAARSAIEHALHAGELLIEAKARCGHGDWSNWLEANFKGSERTAQAYMRVAKHRDKLTKAQTSADLSLDQALKLLAEPKAVKEAPLTERLADLRERLGEAVTVTDCQAIAVEALELQNEAAESRLRAERAAGQMLDSASGCTQKVLRLLVDNPDVDFTPAFDERIAELQSEPQIAPPELTAGFVYRAFGERETAVEFIPAKEPGYWHYHFYDNLDNDAAGVEYTKRAVKLTPQLAAHLMEIHDFRPVTEWQVEPDDGSGSTWAKMPRTPGRSLYCHTTGN